MREKGQLPPQEYESRTKKRKVSHGSIESPKENFKFQTPTPQPMETLPPERP